MSSEAEENKALVRRFLAAEFEWDLEALQEILAPHFVDHYSPGDPGPEGYLSLGGYRFGPYPNFSHNLRKTYEQKLRPISFSAATVQQPN